VNEDDNMAGRVRRYARVGAAVGGLAARLAGQRYLGVRLDRDRHAADLAAALGGLKGPLMKVAQIMSTIPDALPKEYVAELAQLQADAPPMGWPFVKRRMTSELGPDWQGRYRSFEHEAAAAASLGQVHRAVAPDGRLLACKLQYPDMQSAVEADLRQLRLIFSIYERYDRAIVTKDIHAEIAARLREELDYRQEARHMQLYGAMLAKEDAVAVPVALPDLTTGRLLTMTWLEGTPLLPFIKAHASKTLRNRIAYNMFRAWYVPFYYYGVIHGDPHLGNYTIRPDGSVNLLDFGCIRIFGASFVEGVIDLYHALMNDDRDLAVHAYESWGFQNLTNETIAVLNRWAGFVYGPLMEDRERRIQERSSGVYGREVAEGVHADLRRLGPVKPPREFVFMDRAAIGLGSVFMHLGAEINWHRLFRELIEGFDRGELERRQKKLLKRFGLKSTE
jgi:predicted unusual protein kinase regulating ubiquinone biosynthesis (AarF/ABC1/UbiB family)